MSKAEASKVNIGTITSGDQDLGGLLIEALKEIKALREEVTTLNKVFAYKYKKVTRKEELDGMVNEWLMDKMKN